MMYSRFRLCELKNTYLYIITIRLYGLIDIYMKDTTCYTTNQISTNKNNKKSRYSCYIQQEKTIEQG